MDPDDRDEAENPRDGDGSTVSAYRFRAGVAAASLAVLGLGALYGGLRPPYWPLVVAGAVFLVASGLAAWGMRHRLAWKPLALSLLLLIAALVFLSLVSPYVSPASS